MQRRHIDEFIVFNNFATNLFLYNFEGIFILLFKPPQKILKRRYYLLFVSTNICVFFVYMYTCYILKTISYKHFILFQKKLFFNIKCFYFCVVFFYNILLIFENSRNFLRFFLLVGRSESHFSKYTSFYYFHFNT